MTKGEEKKIYFKKKSFFESSEHFFTLRASDSLGSLKEE